MILGAFSVLTFGTVSYHAYLQYQRKGEAPIKQSWLPILGFALEMGVRPLELLRKCAAEYGEIFGLVVAGNRMFIISDPHSHYIIFKSSKNLSVEEFHNSVLINFFGVRPQILSPHCAYDDDLIRLWYSKYLLSDFGLHSLTNRLQKKIFNLFEQTASGSYSMEVFLNKFIFQASIASIFNDKIANDDELLSAFLQFDKSLPLACAGLDIKYLAQSLAGRKALLERIATCADSDGNSTLMQKRYELFHGLEKEGKITPTDTAALQLAILWASVGNTMPTVFWLLYYLLRNAESESSISKSIKQRVIEDIQSLNISDDGFISQEDLNKLILLDACITETLRLASGSFIMRYIREDCTLTLHSGTNYSFRKGDRVGLCPNLTHMDPEVFPDPTAFDPDRWLQGDSQEERVQGSLGKIPLRKNGLELPATMAFLPFGGGATYCPGRRFARNEVKMLCCFLLMNFRIQLDPFSAEPQFDGSRCGLGVFPPKGTVNIVVQKLVPQQ